MKTTEQNVTGAGADRFAEFTIGPDGSIRDAMVAINNNAREFVLVRDAARRILGLISDGDIRRGLLAGRTLESRATEVMTTEFFAVGPEVDRAYVLDLMKARSFQYVPVLDAERRLLALHFLRDLIGADPKPNVAVIMAGGKGARLWPVTETIPKPMVEVAGRPILERIIIQLVGHGIHTVYLAVNYMAEVIEGYFGDGRAFGCRIEYLREREALGTAGALSLLPARPQDPFLVLNGDLITNMDFTAMLQAHVSAGNVATIGAGPFQVVVPFGVIEEKNDRLLSIDEKPTVSFLVNRGVYVLSPSVIDLVPKNCDFPITALFDILLKDKKPVGIFQFDTAWIDVGRPEDLRRAHGQP